MRAVQGVSYPRSGHSIVYQVATRYFGEAFVYCDTNNRRYCGCESVPCVNPQRTFAKNHDFGVQHEAGVPILPAERYLIQYRNPVCSITSNYYLYRFRKPWLHTKGAWKHFAIDSIDYWNRFVDKWVLDFPADANPPFFCSYESLISDPEVRMREILSYMSAEPLEEDAVRQVLSRKPIINRNNMAKFPYYDAGFFREMEALTAGRIARLGLPAFDEIT
jgi:hypothetical protein